MKVGLQHTVATLLASLYLFVAVAGQALHVHSHADASAGSLASSCGCHSCHTSDPADTDSTEVAFRQASPSGADGHDCVACSMLAQMRHAGGVASPSVHVFTAVEFIPACADSVALGPAISQPVARGPPLEA